MTRELLHEFSCLRKVCAFLVRLAVWQRRARSAVKNAFFDGLKDTVHTLCLFCIVAFAFSESVFECIEALEAEVTDGYMSVGIRRR